LSLTVQGYGGSDWYDAAIVLYQGTPPATAGSTIVNAHVIRGHVIAAYKTGIVTIRTLWAFALPYMIRLEDELLEPECKSWGFPCLRISKSREFYDVPGV
jgi:hypothetical protein